MSGTHGERDGAGKQEDRLHPEGVGHVAQGGPVGAESIQRARRVERPPQQRADPLVRGGTHRPRRVGPSGERPPDAGRIRIPAAGLPQQRGRLLGHASRLVAHALIMPSRNRWPRPRPMVSMTVAEGWGRDIHRPGHVRLASSVGARPRRSDPPGPASPQVAPGFRGKVVAPHVGECGKWRQRCRAKRHEGMRRHLGRFSETNRLSRRQAIGRMSVVATAGAAAWVVPEILTAKAAGGATLSAPERTSAAATRHPGRPA